MTGQWCSETNIFANNNQTSIISTTARKTLQTTWSHSCVSYLSISLALALALKRKTAIQLEKSRGKYYLLICLRQVEAPLSNPHGHKNRRKEAEFHQCHGGSRIVLVWRYLIIETQFFQRGRRNSTGKVAWTCTWHSCQD